MIESGFEVQTGITLSRKLSGNIRTRREITESQIVDLCTDWGGETHYWEGAKAVPCNVVDFLACIYTVGGQELASVRLGTRFNRVTVPKSPDPNIDWCPEEYLPDGTHDSTTWIDWIAHSSIMGPTGYYHDDTDTWIAPQTYNSWYSSAAGYGEDPPETILYDSQLAYEVEVTGQFRLMAKYSEKWTFRPFDKHKIYDEYPFDYDPYGMDNRTLEYWYEPILGSVVTAKCSVDGVIRLSKNLSAADFGGHAGFVDMFYNGFGKVYIYPRTSNAFTKGQWETSDQQTSYPDGPLLALANHVNCTIDGITNRGSNRWSGTMGFPLYPPYTGIAHFSSLDNGGIYTYEANALAEHIVYGGQGSGCTIECLSTDITYRVSAKDYNGGAREGVRFEFAAYDGPWEGSHDDNVFIETNQAGEGVTTFCYPGILRGFDLPAERIGARSPSGWQHQHTQRGLTEPGFPYGIGISNLDSLGEPKFPTAPYESGYHDGRLELGVDYPVFTPSEAVTISAPSSSDKILFDNTGWDVVQGSADLSVVNGCLQVVVTSGPCKIQKSYGSIYLTGCRFADLKYTSLDDEQEIRIDLGGGSRYWKIKPTNFEIDLVSPFGLVVDSSVFQSRLGSDIDWSWGVEAVGTLEISELRNGKTYTFEKLMLKRKSSLQVVIFGGAFIGAEYGYYRGSDPYTFFQRPDNWWTRKGIVFVDGMPSAEIRETKHTYISDTVPWEHYSAKLGDSNLLVCGPGDAFVTLTPDPAQGSMEAAFLTPGVYTGENVKIPGKCRAIGVYFPFAAGNHEVRVDRCFRGGIAVRLSDPETPTGTRRVKLEGGPSDTGPWTTIEEYLTDKNGFKLSSALVQPLYNLPEWYRVSTLDVGSNEIANVIQTRNKNVSWIALVGLIPTEVPEFVALDSYKEPLSGMDIIAATDEDGYISIYQSKKEIVSKVSRVSQDVGWLPTILHYPDGRAVVYYKKESVGVCEVLSNDSWKTYSERAVPNPDVSAHSGEVWKWLNTLKLVKAFLGTGRDSGGSKVSGEAFGAGLFLIGDGTTGRPCTVRKGALNASDEWTGWSDFQDVVLPKQCLSVNRTLSGEMCIVFFTGINPYDIKVWVPEVSDKQLDGAGASSDAPITIVSNTAGKHPVIVQAPDSLVYYIAAWEEDLGDILIFKVSPTFVKLHSGLIGSLPLVSGSIPTGPIIEQRLGLRYDGDGSLRVIWWDDTAHLPITATIIGEFV